MHDSNNWDDDSVVVISTLYACACVCATAPLMIEVCNTEIFQPTCSSNEVIIIEKAQYGRLELGQCVSHVT